jgi:hypothetical protein
MWKLLQLQTQTQVLLSIANCLFWKRSACYSVNRFEYSLLLTTTGREVGTINNPDNSDRDAAYTTALTPVDNTAHRLTWQRQAHTTIPTNAADTYNFPLLSNISINPGLDTVPDTPDDTYYRPSLEQRAIRGWVNKREFVARGVLVELKGDTIVITRDDLSDTSVTQPDPNKTWRRADGALIPYAYRMEIRNVNAISTSAMPVTNSRVVGAPGDAAGVYTAPASAFNGVIFAEGNVRVRGFTDVRNITIVSMGNIYVEGGINKRNTDPALGNVALLAKRNVIANPTQILARVEGSQSTGVANINIQHGEIDNRTGDVSTVDLPPRPPVFPATLGVPAASLLRIGDQVRFPGAGAQWHTITAIQPQTLTLGDTTQITFTPPIPQNTAVGAVPIPIGTLVRLNTADQAANVTKTLQYTDRGDVAARDIRLDGATAVGEYRIRNVA